MKFPFGMIKERRQSKRIAEVRKLFSKQEMTTMKSILIKDTTREEREQIVRQAL